HLLWFFVTFVSFCSIFSLCSLCPLWLITSIIQSILPNVDPRPAFASQGAGVDAANEQLMVSRGEGLNHVAVQHGQGFGQDRRPVANPLHAGLIERRIGQLSTLGKVRNDAALALA